MNISATYNVEEKYWYTNGREQLFNEQISIGTITLYMLRSKPIDAVCQISDSEGTTLTYGTICSYAIRVAQRLRDMAIGVDDVIGIMAYNTTLLAPVLAGCLMNGTPFHPVNPIHEEDVIAHLFAITKPRIIFCDGNYLAKLRSATSNLKPLIFTLCNHVDGVRDVNELLVPTTLEMFYQATPLKYGPSQTVAIVCSSGKSGKPKAVHISNKRLIVDLSFLSGADVMFSFSTPDSGTGLFMLCASLMNGGTRIITTRPYSPKYLLQIVIKYGVSFLLSSSLQLTQAVQLPKYTAGSLRSLKFIFLMGSSTSIAMQSRIHSQLECAVLLNAYSTTEIGAIATRFQNHKANSVGKLVQNIQLKIVDLKSGARLGPNEVGEIWVRPKIGWRGYYNNTEATAEVMDSNGWICSGDVGYMDDEFYLFLVERSKDIMKCMGMQYSLTEIEDAIRLLPEVLDVCVFGVYEEQRGDLAAAAVVLQSGSKLIETDVQRHVMERYQVQHKHLNYGVFIVDAIARNAKGKLLRQKTKEMCLEMERKKTGNKRKCEFLQVSGG